MANIRADVPYAIKDGSEVGFRSPVDCSQITGLVVYYTAEDGTTASQEFLLTDAHGQDVGNIDHLFAEDVIVKVILDCTHGKAYVQNADTNDYIEKTFVKTVNGVGPDENGNVEVEVGKDTDVDADPKGTAAKLVREHDQDGSAHSDIREEIEQVSQKIPDVSGFVTRLVSDLVNYYTTDQTYCREEIDSRISSIPKFAIEVVAGLPGKNISSSTIYLVRNGNEEDLYSEYIFVNGAWELLGRQRVDLTGYATEAWATGKFQPLGNYLTTHQSLEHLLPRKDLADAINTALAQARDSGEFNGGKGDDGLTPHVGDNGNWWIGDDDLGVSASGTEGQRGCSILYVTTTPTSYTTAIGGKTPAKRMSISTIKSQAGVDEVIVGDLVQHSYYLYHIYYMDGSYAYMESGRSIRGSAGAGGKTTITEVVGLPYGSAPTITEADGSTSTDRKYILGIPAGAPGEDYALTDKDMAEIAGMVVENPDSLAVITNRVLSALPTWNGGAY